jgi:hypothetical protein
MAPREGKGVHSKKRKNHHHQKRGGSMALKKAFSLFRCIFLLLLLAGTAFPIVAINAPYAIEAQAADDHHITVSWRNNDVSTERFLLFRKTLGALFQKIDSVPGTATSFVDSGIAPSTEYFYAVRAYGQGQISDTSNVVSATTAALVRRFGSPAIAFYVDSVTKIPTISYFDSCTVEKGFRIYRQDYPDSFSLLASPKDSAPNLMGWRTYRDSSAFSNHWYGYKVEVFGDSLSLFSPETTFYTYVEPQVSHTYSFTKLSEFPISPVGWTEKIGDSLYVVENAGNSTTAISVIDISDRKHPGFKGYLRSDSLPGFLQKTWIAAYCKLGVETNPPWSRQIASFRGFYFVFRGDTLFQYDSSSLNPVNSIGFAGLTQGRIIGQINDSLVVVNAFVSAGGAPASKNSSLYTCRYSATKFEIVDTIQLVTNYYNEFNLLGYKDKKIYFYTYSCHPTCGGSYVQYYHVCDYSLNPLRPFHYRTKALNFRNIAVCPLDSFVTFRFFVHAMISDSSLDLTTFDIRSAASIPLSTYTDGQFRGGVQSELKDCILDSANSQIFIIGAKSFAIYKYSRTDLVIQNRPQISKDLGKNTLFIRYISHGVLINIRGAGQGIKDISIYDVRGRTIRSFRSIAYTSSEWFLWDKKNDKGEMCGQGSYFLIVRHVKRMQTAKISLLN